MNYNPFDLQPPKNVIKSGLFQLKQAAAKLLYDIQILNQIEFADWLVVEKQKHHQQLLHKIRRYEMYLRDEDMIDHFETAKMNAKSRPILDFYPNKLRKLGKKYIGKCPFHQDDSPSFVIYPNNRFHCFGCQLNGDSIDFIMKLQHLTMSEAIKFLA